MLTILKQIFGMLQLGIIIKSGSYIQETRTIKAFVFLLAAPASMPLGYAIGTIIALLILGYLIYTLIRPEKF